MTAAVRKRQRLEGMRYDRVDLVADGANAHAHIRLAKNRNAGPEVKVVRKAMGSVKCNDCGKMNGRGAQTCRYCNSTDLAKTRIDVVKTTVNPKKTPKNDDATNPGDYTFEDQQYDQDDDENGTVTGDSVERSVNKGWFEFEGVRKDDIDDVDNEKREKMVEGEDDDDDIEALAQKKPTGLSPDRRSGYKNTATGSNDTTGMTFKSRRSGRQFRKGGRASLDYGDEGSQEVSESAEQMYRSQSQPGHDDSEKRESTRSDVFTKARRKRGREGLDMLENGNAGIYQRPGVKRNGTNTGHNKTTNRGRTAVAPPRNQNDVGKSFLVRKNKNLPVLEALFLGVGLAENIGLIMKANRPDLYEQAVEDFLDTLNASAGEWFAGSSVTKSKDAGAQAEDIADRVNAILHKASPQAEMSDKNSEGGDSDEDDMKGPKVSAKPKNVGGDESGVGKTRNVNKSVSDEDDIYKGLHPEVVAKLRRADELEELRTQETYLKKARELRNLPNFDEEKIAKQLRSAYEDDDETGDYLFQTMAAAATQLNDNAVFKQFGLPGGGSTGSDDPMDRADAWAKSQVSKSGDGTTVEVLRAQYMREHGADFYQPAKSV